MKIRIVNLGETQYADAERYARLLPQERREKIARLRFDSDKLLSLTAGLLIRAEVGDVPLTLNEHGKPYAVGTDRFFSVSHSSRCVVIAVDDEEIGADVEKLPDRDHQKLAERFFHPNELAYVQKADDPVRAFARIWTRKEAYLKQIGIGIATDLKAFDTTSGELSERIMTRDIDGYAISVCSAYPVEKDDVYISVSELKDLLS